MGRKPRGGSQEAGGGKVLGVERGNGGGRLCDVRAEVKRLPVMNVCDGGAERGAELAVAVSDALGGKPVFDDSLVVEPVDGEGSVLAVGAVDRPELRVAENKVGAWKAALLSGTGVGMVEAVAKTKLQAVSGAGARSEVLASFGEGGSPAVQEVAEVDLAKGPAVMTSVEVPLEPGQWATDGSGGGKGKLPFIEVCPLGGGAGPTSSPGISTEFTSPSVRPAGFSKSVRDSLRDFVPQASVSRHHLPNAWTVKHCRELVFTDMVADYTADDGVTVQMDLPDVASCKTRLESALVGRIFGRLCRLAF